MQNQGQKPLEIPPCPNILLPPPPQISSKTYDYYHKRRHIMQINGEQQFASTKDEVDKKLTNVLKKAEQNSKETQSKAGEEIKVDPQKYTNCTRCNKSVLKDEMPTHMSCHAAIILDNLLLGDIVSAQSKKELVERNKVTHILNAAYELPNYLQKEGLKYFQLELLDDLDQQLEGELQKACNFIREAHRDGGIVFVHCRVGKSRSVSAILAYLLREKGIGIEEGLAMVKQKRPIAQPNKSYMRQLIEYEKKWISESKKQMAESKIKETQLKVQQKLPANQRSAQEVKKQ